jgi:hypothetical protein
MTGFTITNRGLDEMIRNLANPVVAVIFKDAANRSVAEVARLAQSEVPKRTHQLAQSHIVIPATLGSPHAEVYTEKEYAVPVHDGHGIVAWGRDTGRMQPPNPWMERAVAKADSVIDAIFDNAIERVTNELTK